MHDALLLIGVLQLASAALLGWLITLQRGNPAAVRRLGIVAPRRIMQLHLDQVMMGLIVLAVATAFPDVPDWIALALAVGTVLNPLAFIPLAFKPKAEEGIPFRMFIGFSFSVATVAFVSLAVWVALGR